VILWHRSPAWPAEVPLDVARWPLEPVKAAAHRSVSRVRLGDFDFHVKHYRPDTRERLRAWVRWPKGRTEYQRGVELLRRGVPTLEPLAWGVDGLDSYVVTRTLPEAVPLLDWLETRPTLGDFPERLGAFLARCHAAGVCHADLHPGNLLLDRSGGLYLIDLHLAQLGNPLAHRAAAENLVMLDRWFALRYSRTHRLRAFRAYALLRPEIRLHAGELAQQTATSLRRYVRELDVRCRGRGRHFARIPGGIRLASFDSAVLQSLRASANAWLDAPDAVVLKRSASSTVIERPLPFEGRVQPLIVKRMDATRWTDAWTAWFRPDAATRSWRMGHALALRGLPTPRCLAVWHVGATGYLVQEKVPEAVYLKEFLDRLPAETLRRRRDLARQVGRLVRQLHAWEIRHRDLKAPNLLVSPARPVLGVRGLEAPEIDGGDHVWLVDLVGASLCPGLEEGRKVRDLARLHASFWGDPRVSRTDCLRVLASYLHEGLRGRGGWKKWWRAIARRSEAKRQRNERMGRVLG
jgi:tRNA A-37 threonylcarbamoyl transferase component Bud32